MVCPEATAQVGVEVLAMDVQEGEYLDHAGSIPKRDRVYRMSYSPRKKGLDKSRIVV